jgi:hypothetical protein
MAMGLLDTLQADILGPKPLSDVLRQAKVLAYRLQNQEFKVWVDRELDGYRGMDSVPEYRIIAVPSFGNFSNGAWLHKHSPMPMEVFPQDMQDMLNRTTLRQCIRELESMLESMARSEAGYLRTTWPSAARNYVSSQLEGDYHCIDAWQTITPEPIVGILDTVKNRLLTLTLELADRYPEAAQLDFTTAASNPSSKQVAQVVQYTIYGDHAILNPGNSTTYHTEAPTMNEVTIGDGNTFHGDMVVAHTIEQSFNRATASDLADPMKELLRQLVTAVGTLGESLQPEEAEQAARDVEVLTTEATSKTPRKQWIHLSAEGLTKAATNVGKLGVPVVALLKEIVPLLTGP